MRCAEPFTSWKIHWSLPVPVLLNMYYISKVEVPRSQSSDSYLVGFSSEICWPLGQWVYFSHSSIEWCISVCKCSRLYIIANTFLLGDIVGQKFVQNAIKYLCCSYWPVPWSYERDLGLQLKFLYLVEFSFIYFATEDQIQW